MRGKVILRRSGIRSWDWLLIFGIILAPMTGLRIWKVGPAEVLCLLWTLKYYPRRYLKINDTLKFFSLFLTAMFIGMLIGRLKAPGEVNAVGYLTWLYLAYIAMAFYEGLRRNSMDYNEKLLQFVAEYSILWYLFLYYYSRLISTSFFGAPLWYANFRYSGGATNPHQLAVMMCGVAFILLRQAVLRRRRLWSLLLCFICVFLISQTKSSTGYAALALGLLAEVYFFGASRMHGKRQRIALAFAELVIAAALVILFRGQVTQMLYEWIASDKNGLGRLQIFSSFFTAFAKSPLVGLGPGVHGLNGAIEFHNTYLEILAATGLIGFGVFIVYTVRILKKLSSDMTLVPILIAIYAYGLAGFAMRRLVYWGILMLILAIGEQRGRLAQQASVR